MSNAKYPVQTDDAHAGVLAALARADKVPTSSTLIDQVPDADWTNEDVSNWNINAGSALLDDNELHDCDKPQHTAA